MNVKLATKDVSLALFFLSTNILVFLHILFHDGRLEKENNMEWCLQISYSIDYSIEHCDLSLKKPELRFFSTY